MIYNCGTICRTRLLHELPVDSQLQERMDIEQVSLQCIAVAGSPVGPTLTGPIFWQITIHNAVISLYKSESHPR